MRKKANVEVLGPVEDVESELYTSLRAIISKGLARAYRAANRALVETYWSVGAEIVARQGGLGRAAYGDKLIERMSSRLQAEFGKGYTIANLRNMRQFYTMFPIRQTLSSELSWSHYCLLMRVEKKDARTYYANEAVKGKWSFRVLRRQISSFYYERLLRNQADPGGLRQLVKAEPLQTRDFIHNPAVLEFTGLSDGRYDENDLERALITNMRIFLMELGRGFCLEGEQRPIRIDDKVYHCDLVFYNYLARCFFLIDLKVGEVTPEDLGQMQLYKHYYEREMMNPGDNPPVGVVLGSEKNDAVVRYTLNEHERNLFAVKYHLHLPTVEELQLELQRERAAIEEALVLRGRDG